MTWHYQITKRIESDEAVFAIREVYMDVPVAGARLWTENAITPMGDSRAEIITCLEMMLADAKRYPVLDLDKVEKKP